MKIGKTILIIVVALIIVWVAGNIVRGDTYVGFYYPDANNLTNDIQSSETFNSLESCRDWIDEQVSTHNPDGTGYDYECGKNCDLSGGKPYVCEETLE